MDEDEGRETMNHQHGTREIAHPPTTRLAFTATAHCLAGCSIGEILGMMLGAGLDWRTGMTVGVSVILAFTFGYAFTVVPLLRSGFELVGTLKLALASDTLSIIVMEVVDNGIMLLVPGAMDAGLAEPLFWASLAGSLLLAGLAAFPLNRWLIARGRGHALVHAQHDSMDSRPGKRSIEDSTGHRDPTGHGSHDR
jgi:hypothetical protein